MAKRAGECFLCGEDGKGRPLTFYSGVRKGGSRTELLSATVIVHEWWKDLTIHEVFICRECQDRIWAQQINWTPILCAIAAVGLFLFAIPFAFFGILGLVIAAILALVALGTGGAALWLRTQERKPTRDLLEPLLVKEAMKLFPDEGRTFMTNDQYSDLVGRGIIG